MGDLSQWLAKLRRIPERFRRDAWMIATLANWREAISAEWNRTQLHRLRLRNGIMLDGPETIKLTFLFQETWLRQIYSPPGYEIQRDDTVIDIGANIGVFATYAATRSPDVTVHAYEPFPGNAQWLCQNIERSKLNNVRVHKQAVGAASGVRHLQVNSDDWIMHSLFGEGTARQRGLPVECVSFDEVMNAEAIMRCDLLKIDCEGSEYEILERCSAETLGRVRRIVGEFHEGPDIEGTGEQLCRFLESRSFQIDQFKRQNATSGVFSARNLGSQCRQSAN